MRGSFLFVAASAGAYVLTPGRISSGTKQQQRADTMMVKQVPHGGTLVDLFTGASADGADFTIELNDRQSCDVELLCNGGFSPLTGFMTEETYTSVVNEMQLPDGLVFGLPVVMDTDNDAIVQGSKLLLTYKGTNMAMMTVESKWTPDKPTECLKCYETASIEHPGVRMVAMERGAQYIGGKLEGLGVPTRDFPCKTPKETRADLPEDADVVAFQCRNPVHRAHYELFTRALDAPNVADNAVVLVHPTCGPTQEEDIPGPVRFKTYEVLQEETKDTDKGKKTKWAYLPYSMHMAGPREAIHHMMIRKNFGCTHFIIGRDMAGSKSSVTGDDFYGAFDAQDLGKAKADELGVQVVPSLNLVYTAEEDYLVAEEAKEKGYEVKKLSGTKFRKMLRQGDEIPEWFAFKSVVDVLRAEWK
jgi:sulfate adenylyltransferase